MTNIFSSAKTRVIMKILLLLIVLGAVVLFAFWYVNGPSLGPKSFAGDFLFFIKNTPGLLLNAGKIRQVQENQNNILFLHHSVGAGFIRDGKLRELLQENGYPLWDQGYRGDLLSGPDGKTLGFSYNIVADNTDPDGLYALFSQRQVGLPLNGFSQVMQHDIIVLKSCYPVSYIDDDAKLGEYQHYYLGIREVMDRHPEKLFIILTQPPLNPATTDAEIALRARKLANWLASDEFVNGRRNLAVFDLFNLLAESDQSRPDANMLRADFREGEDSHPNAKANGMAAQQIAAFVTAKARDYQQK
jgi:hypothetical protein